MTQTLEGAKAPGKPEKASHIGAGEPSQTQKPAVAVTGALPGIKTTVTNRNVTVTNRNNPPGSGWGALLPAHGAELEASGIAPDVAALNAASFGPGTERHWETERADLTRHKRHQIQTESRTGSGHPQTQPGHLSPRLANLDRCYRHLEHGGWRTLSDALPGLDLPIFDQWKPAAPEPKYKRDPRTNEWRLVLDEHGRPRLKKYEAPPGCPDGGGLLLPHVPDRCWEAIARRHGLPFPEARGDGFWAWVLATPSLPLLVCEGWKKCLAAVSAGHAAVALPGATMGRRVAPDGSERLIPALQALAKGRPLTVALDAERKPSTARKMAAAAGALAHCLRIAKGKPAIAWLPLLPGTDKTGLDDLWVAGGPEALDRALADTAPRPVLPHLRAADRIAPAGQWLGVACPIPSPEGSPLVVISAPMGAGKTRAIEEALRPLLLDGVPILLPSHRRALGQALAEQVGIPWEATPGTDERLQGVSGCLDSWCQDSRLQITGETGTGGELVLDEWMQQAEHLLLGTGTALTDPAAPRRAAGLRTLGEQMARMRQVIASDGQMAQWGVDLLEALTGRRALLIRSEHQPMAGRPLHCPAGFTTPQKAAEAFRAKLAQTVEDLPAGGSLLVWCSAQKGEKSQNAPVNLAQWHRSHRPADLVDVIDSTTKDLAAELAADPDGFAERRIREAAAQGGSWVLYCSPAVSSGISFQRWRPAAVIAYSGGRIAPEHVAQALARVRCPEVSCWIFAPERSPGAALRVGSGRPDPAALISDLRKTTDPLLGALQASGAEEAWLKAWGELGAIRNRQRFAYRATIAGLLQREGWCLQEPAPEPCPIAGAALGAELKAIRDERREAKQQAILTAEPLTAMEAARLDRLDRRRRLELSEAAALERYQLLERWGMAPEAPLSLELLVADEDRPADRLKLAWLLSCTEAIALVPAHDRLAIARLDPEHRRPFGPDRRRVALGPTLDALWDLGIPGLLERFKSGETIAATDPAVLALHANAKKHVATLGVSPGKLPTGTLRNLLRAVGWELKGAGRIMARTGERGAYVYTAAPPPLPEGASWEALEAKWMAELRGGGTKIPPIRVLYRGEKSANHPPHPPHPSPPLLKRSPLAPAVAVPWPSGPPRPRPTGFAVVA